MSLDSLPADQRAVLQLVLQRGRTYDEIGEQLRIERAAVRQRAIAALESLGPQTGLDAKRRAQITDYLLDQLPRRAANDERDRLATSPADRAWARVVAAELAPMAPGSLPEIPAESSRPEPASNGEPPPIPAVRASVAGSPAGPPGPSPEEVAAAAGLGDSSPAGGEPGSGGPPGEEPSAGPAGGSPKRRPSSLVGGAILLGVGLIAAVVVAVLAISGGSSKQSATSAGAGTPTTTAASTASSTTATTPQVVRQINLTSSSPTSKIAGLADVLKQGNTKGIAIVAQSVPPNTKHDAYAVWLYNTPTDSHILGFVNPGVGKNGRLSTAGALPTNAGHYKQLIVTLETHANPKVPGRIILQGPLSLS